MGADASRALAPHGELAVDGAVSTHRQDDPDKLNHSHLRALTDLRNQDHSGALAIPLVHEDPRRIGLFGGSSRGKPPLVFGTLEHTRATAEEKTADALPVNAKYSAEQPNNRSDLRFRRIRPDKGWVAMPISRGPRAVRLAWREPQGVTHRRARIARPNLVAKSVRRRVRSRVGVVEAHRLGLHRQRRRTGLEPSARA